MSESEAFSSLEDQETRVSSFSDLEIGLFPWLIIGEEFEDAGLVMTIFP